MHQNPVKRGLVLEPQQWAWSSFRHYEYGESGAVLVNETQTAGGWPTFAVLVLAKVGTHAVCTDVLDLCFQ